LQQALAFLKGEPGQGPGALGRRRPNRPPRPPSRTEFPAAFPGLNDQQLLRYSRHILLGEIGIEGQERLRAAHALVVGAGGLGCPAALYLAASGIGRLTLADPDTVDLTNLQRQVLYRTDSVGTPKGGGGTRRSFCIES
jgi:hypothetical protein